MKPSSHRINERNSYRRPFYPGEGLRVVIISGSTRVTGETFDLSSTGAGIAVNIDDKYVNSLSLGDPVHLKFTKDKNVISALVVHISHQDLRSRNCISIGLLFVAERAKKYDEKRVSKRYVCHSELKPSAIISNPFFFNDYLFFSIEDISSGGATLKTLAQDVIVLKDQVFSITVNIPIFGSFNADVKIKDLKHSEGTEQYSIGVNFIKPSIDLMNAISEYLLITNNGITLTELRKNGFPLTNIKKSIRFGYARSKDDLDEILKLRLSAHQSWGRLKEAKDPKNMLEQYDEFARHIVCRISDKIVACARVIFIENGEIHKSDIARYVEIPDFIKKDKFVELTRICTDPAYRGSDIFSSIVQNTVRICIQSNSKYLIGATIDDLWPVYKKMGMKKFGKPIDNPLQPGQNLNFIYASKDAFITGKHADFLLWNYMFFPVIDFLHRSEGLELKAYDKMIIGFNKAVNPAVSRLVNSKTNKKAKAKSCK